MSRAHLINPGGLPGRVRRVASQMRRATTTPLRSESLRGMVGTQTGQAVAGPPRRMCGLTGVGSPSCPGITLVAVEDAPEMTVAHRAAPVQGSRADTRIAPSCPSFLGPIALTVLIGQGERS